MPHRRASLICILVCTAAMTAAAARPGGKYWAASIQPQPFPEIRFTSGLTTCDEVLWKGRTYNVTFLNSGRTITIPGDQLLQNGVPVRLEENLTSELLIFHAK
jgi:hypothetical protein